MEDKILDAMSSEDERIGAGILIKSLSAPCMQIAENAGVEGAVVLSKIQALSLEQGVSTLMHLFLPIQGITECYFAFSLHILYSPIFKSLSKSSVWLWLGRWEDGILQSF
jgi:hypothetical protein